VTRKRKLKVDEDAMLAALAGQHEQFRSRLWPLAERLPGCPRLCAEAPRQLATPGYARSCALEYLRLSDPDRAADVAGAYLADADEHLAFFAAKAILARDPARAAAAWQAALKRLRGLRRYWVTPPPDGTDSLAIMVCPVQKRETLDESRVRSYRQHAPGDRGSVIAYACFDYRGRGANSVISEAFVAVVLDGHHKLAAAVDAGEPVDVLAILESGIREVSRGEQLREMLLRQCAGQP
jgi:hypothetical protein